MVSLIINQGSHGSLLKKTFPQHYISNIEKYQNICLKQWVFWGAKFDLVLFTITSLPLF